MAYATPADYAALFGDVADVGMLEAKLRACSTVIDAELAANGAGPEDVRCDLLSLVCCQMAERLMPKGGSDVPAGVTSVSEMVGPYSHTFSFGSPYGSPKLLDDELRLLLGSGRGARMAWAPIGVDHE